MIKNKQRPKLRTNPIVVISCEGYTEYDYFKHLKNKLENKGLNVIPFTNGEETMPDQVFKKLTNYVDDNVTIKESDRFWIVIDNDRDDAKSKIKTIEQTITKNSYKEYRIAKSNPKFEFWLLLHFCKGTGLGNSDLTKLLNKENRLKGFEKRIDHRMFGKLNPNIDTAIENAKALSVDNPYQTDVYRLVGELV